ncbi:BatD family protein [Myxosarcina sp. GI1(2024)]
MKFASAKKTYSLALSLMKRLWSGFVVMLIISIFISVGGYPLAALADESSFTDESPSVLVRTNLKPEHPVVGQQVEFQVDVFVDTWFAKAPQFPEIQIEDAIALLPPTASINLNERIDGKFYAGQRRTYFLFPQLPGRYVIPELSPTVVPARLGNSTNEPVSLSTPSVDFLARLPPDLTVRSDRAIVATPQLHLETQLKIQGTSDPSRLRQLHTGDILERTVKLTAADTLVAMLPGISVTDIPGLSVYPDPPKLTNQFERGQFKASRSDRISYVAQQPGNYQLPEQTIYWWDTRTQSLETDTLPAVKVWVKPTAQQLLVRLLPWLAGLLTLISVLVYFRSSLQAKWQRFRQHRQNSERYQWQRLCHASLSNDPEATWSQLIAWLASIQPSPDPVILENFLERANSSPLTQAVRELEYRLFAPQNSTESPSAWSGRALMKALSQIRKSKLPQLPDSPSFTFSLPPLNPVTRQNTES